MSFQPLTPDKILDGLIAVSGAVLFFSSIIVSLRVYSTGLSALNLVTEFESAVAIVLFVLVFAGAATLLVWAAFFVGKNK